MACFHPLSGYRAEAVNPDTGKHSIVFDRRKARFGGVLLQDQIEVPCGQCIGCRLERSRQWALRCVHEASLHDENCFITLTYDPEHLPIYFRDDGPALGTLCKEDFQNFMKRLRERIGTKIRFFHCGEYGEQLGRPHYHAIIFGYDFADKTPIEVSDGGHNQFVSEMLTEVWGKGRCTIGAVTFDSAAYVARDCVS